MMMKTTTTLTGCNRRQFLKTTGMLAAASTAPLILPRRVFGADAPGNKVTMGFIGCGRQAYSSNIPQFMAVRGVQVVAVCDVDSWRLDQAKKLVEGFYTKKNDAGFKGCEAYKDFRELLARPDMDAVMISTPDHWHVPMAIAAVKAGKDVSLEKPITRYINEGRMLADLCAKHKRVFRVDSEFRSLEPMHRAAELVRNGRIGKLEDHAHRIAEGGFPERTGDRDRTAAGTRLRPVARPGAEGGLHPEARPHAARSEEPPRLDAQSRLLRRHDHQLGHAPQRHRASGARARSAPARSRSRPPAISTMARSGTCWSHSTPGTSSPMAWSCSTRWARRTCASRARRAGSRSTMSQDKLHPEKLEASDPAILKEKIGPEEIHFPLRSEKEDFIECVRVARPDARGRRGRPAHHLALPSRPHRDPARRRETRLGPRQGSLHRTTTPPTN